MGFLPDNRPFAWYTAGVAVILVLAVIMAWTFGPCYSEPMADDDSADPPMTPDELREYLETATADDGDDDDDDDSAKEATP